MAWCDVVERRTLRECRIALGQSQAAFAAMLGVVPRVVSDLGCRAAGDDRRKYSHERVRWRRIATTTRFCPLPVLALLIGVHVKTLRSAARDGRLPVIYDTRTTFRRLRARATPAAARTFRRSYYGRTVRPDDRRAPLTWASVPRRLRRADSRGASRARIEPSAIGHRGGRGADKAVVYQWEAQETHAIARCSGNESPRSTGELGAGD